MSLRSQLQSEVIHFTEQGELQEQLRLLEQQLVAFRNSCLKHLREPESKVHVTNLPLMQKLRSEEKEQQTKESFAQDIEALLSQLIENRYRIGFNFIVTIQELQREVKLNETVYKQLAEGVNAFHTMIGARTPEELLEASQKFEDSRNALPYDIKSRIQQPGEILRGSMSILLGTMTAYLGYSLVIATGATGTWLAFAAGMCFAAAIMAIGAGIACIQDGLNSTSKNLVKDDMRSLQKLFTFFSHGKLELTPQAQAVMELTVQARA